MAEGFRNTGDLDLASAHRILNAVPAVLYVYDVKDQKSIFQNRHLAEILGYPGEGSDRKIEWQRFIHPEDAVLFREHRQRLNSIKAGETLTWQFRMKDAAGEWRWFQSRDALFSQDENGKPHLILGNASDISEQKEIERQKDLLANEMRHRSRNFATVVSALAAQTRPKDEKRAIEAFDTFASRLRVLLETGNVVLASDVRKAALRDVLRAAIAPLAQDDNRVSMRGPDVSVSEQIAGGFALVAHELTTNAMKYGALSTPSGRVEAEWDCGANGLTRFSWIEAGGPPVRPPQSEGFGTRLLRTAIPHSRAWLNYPREGFRFEMTFSTP